MYARALAGAWFPIGIGLVLSSKLLGSNYNPKRG